MRLFFRIAAVLFLVMGKAAFAADSPVYIVVDIEKGEVISHEGANVLWHPASVTKLMTAYVTFRAIRAGKLTLESPVVVSRNALSEPPSKMGYKVGTEMTLENALKMMIVKSANDIAVAVAETAGGSEAKFVAQMNAEAKRLGMASTRYGNPNGLPNDNQVTTARDMAVLARALWLEFPEYRDLFRIPAIRVGKKILRSHNTLLERFPGTNGMKTGFICSSGFNIVATATRRGRTLGVVVLGAGSSKERAEVAAKLLKDGFKLRLFTGSRPVLASFGARPARGPAVDLRADICGKRKSPRKLRGILAGGDSALGPRFVLMDPVRVTTGVPKGAAPSSARNIPIPRPRPRLPGDSAAIRPQVVPTTAIH